VLHTTSDAEKIARHRAFWQRGETDRPLIGATISTFPSVRAVRGYGVLSPDDLDIGENVRELEEEWEQWRSAMGDAIWSAMPLWAFPWHLAIAGCPIQRDEDNLWALPALDDWSQLDTIQLDRANPWFQLLIRLILALKESSAGRFPVTVGQLMLGPVDMMMQLRGQERLALDLHDAPEKVLALGERCAGISADICDALFPLVDRHHGGYCGTIRCMWAPDRLVESAEDISFMMSPAAHRRFVVPIHRAFGRRIPHAIVHLHSKQLHTVDNLLRVDEIPAIQITPDFGEDMRHLIPTMAKILEHKPLIVHGIMAIEAAKEIIQALPPRGFALIFRCDSPDEAKGTLESLL
jgi:hypothetical protein